MQLTRRHFVALSATGLAAGATLGLAPTAQGQQKVALRVSSSMPADKNAAHFAWFEQFQAKLQQSVGDRLKLDYFPNSQLGKEADVVQQVKVGSIDMMISGSSIWATVAPEFGMLDLGYMFDGFEHAAKAIDSGAGEKLSNILANRTKASVLGWGFSFGPRNVYTKKPVAALADLKEVKLRVLPAPAFIETFKIMGAIPTPIPVNELYTALQTGVVDGFEHDAGTVLAQKFYEVSTHCFATEHLFGPIVAVIGRRGLDKISADLLPAFQKAALDATLQQRAIAVEAANAAMAELRGLGVKVSAMSAEERRRVQKLVGDALYAPFQQQYPDAKAVFDSIAAARTA